MRHRMACSTVLPMISAVEAVGSLAPPTEAVEPTVVAVVSPAENIGSQVPNSPR